MFFSVALFTQHVNLISMCRITLQSAVCCAALHFGTLSYKRHEFGRRFVEYKMFVQIFCTVLCETFLILRRIQPSIIITVNRRSCKLLFFFSEFIHTGICRQIFEVLKYKILKKILPVYAEFFQSDRRTHCPTDTPHETNSRSSLSCECLERQIK